MSITLDWKRWGMAILSGLMMVVCFPSLNWEGTAWLALVPLFLALEGLNSRQAFGFGFLFGVVRYAGVLYWLIQTMSVYGHLPVSVSTLFYFMLVVTMALFDAIFTMVSVKTRKEGINQLFFAPCLWVSLELLRSIFMSGFPWESLGYSQYLFLPLIQIADITGMYGISFLIVMANAVIAECVMTRWGREKKRLPAKEIAVILVLLLLSMGYGLWRLQAEEERINACSSQLRVGLLQGNIKQDLKWTADYQQETLDIYKELSRQAASEGAEFIVWPETAAPFFFQSDRLRGEQIRELARELDLPLFFGSPAYKVLGPGKINLLNRAYLLSREGSLLGTYDKIHLVPFGEYVPYQFIFGFVHKMVQAAGDFSPGKEFSLLTLTRGEDDVKFGTLICYELIFPDLARKFVKKGANFLVTITNDAWFGRTSAPYQHFSMGVFRSVENRVWLVRAANTGISGVVDPLGRMRVATGIFSKDYVVEDICPGSYKTFYTLYGDVFVWGCLAVIHLVFSGLLIRRIIARVKKK